MRPAFRLISPLTGALTLTACTAQQSTVGIAADGPGFLLGLWHGFIFPVAWVASVFVPRIAVYAVPNNGGWYDFGYFLGIVVFGVGARRTQTVYRTRIVERPARRGTVIDNGVVENDPR